MVGRLGRTPRKPVHKCVGDREPEGEGGGGEVSLRPRAGSGRRDAPLGSGGKSSGPFGHEEGVGGEDATDVVLPADVRVPLEVVQSQLALQVLGYALGTPALLDASDDLFPRHRFRERRKDVVLDGAIAFGLLHQEPLRLAARVLAGDDSHADGRESRVQRASTSLPPGHFPVAARADDPPAVSTLIGSVFSAAVLAKMTTRVGRFTSTA
jgi:hypothetical protein